MGNDSVARRYATCRTCGRSIINEGKGWYHQPSNRPPLGGRINHFAEPKPVPR